MFSFASLFFVLLSVLVCIIKTLPSEKVRIKSECYPNMTYEDTTNALLTLDSICNLYFFIELLFKLVVTPRLYQFIMSLETFIDVVALIPFFLVRIYTWVDVKKCFKNDSNLSEVFSFPRIRD